MNCIIVAVAHDEFKQMGLSEIEEMFESKDNPNVIVDVKGIFKIDELKNSGLVYWRL